MKFSNKNIIGLIGLFACAANGVATVAELLSSGRRIYSFLRSPLGVIVGAYVQENASESPHAQAVGYWLYPALYTLLVAAFAWAIWQRTKPGVKRTSFQDTCLLTMQVVIGLGVDRMLLMIVAAELALVLSRRNAVYWLCLLLAVYSATRMPFLLGLGSFSSPPNLTGAVIDSYMMLVWMVVSFGVGCLAAVERLGRIELATAHAKLLSTQHLLTDTLRISERVRIAQNLHDAIGHHLTALNLHLELGLRQVGSQAVESFYISRGLAQSMLSEIRHIVNIEREDRVICLREALELLCSGIPTSLIALSYDPALELDDPILVHTIFRSVQEAITNAVRHSAASNIEVALVKQSACVKISVHDNGKGAPIFVEGNGLKGMRERIEELSGTLVVTNQPPDGFALHFLLPLPGEQS